MTENGRCLCGEQMSMTFGTNGDEDTDSLIADMWSYINVPVNQRNSLKERFAIYDDLADRMHELGIEV